MRKEYKPLSIGQVIGRWTLLEDLGVTEGRRRFFCECECGTAKSVTENHLKRRTSLSCGCERIKNGTKHGMYQTKVYNVWENMIQRCFNPKSKNYHRYGGRGITVCEEWRDFTKFLSDMGEPPIGTEIDRIDNDGNYEPCNCRWVTHLVNTDNRPTTKRYLFDGQHLTINELSKMTGINRTRLATRLKRGYPVDQAIIPDRIRRNRSAVSL